MATRPEAVEARSGITGGQAGLVIIGLLVLLGVLWMVFLRGEPDGEVAFTPAPATPTTEPTPEETSVPRNQTGSKPIETFEVFAPKDPFRPLISDAAAATAIGTVTGAATPVPGATSAPGQTAPSGGSDISGDGTGTTGGGGSGSSKSVSGHRVRLIDTFRRNGRPAARVQVDGTVYTVQEGDRFAENFELLSVSGDCASMLYGDDEFSLCEGEEILK